MEPLTHQERVLDNLYVHLDEALALFELSEPMVEYYRSHPEEGIDWLQREKGIDVTQENS